MKKEVLRIENGEKMQHQMWILKDIYLQIFEKENFGLIFHNIQEKEIFLDIMKGEEKFDGGYLYLQENLLFEEEFCKKMKNHVSVIGKGEVLFSNMTVLENIYLMEMNRNDKFIDMRKYEKRVKKLLRDYSLNISFGKKVGFLTLLEKVIIEMISAIDQGKKLIVLEDVIALIQKKNVLWEMMRKLKKRGITFLLVESLNMGILNYIDRIGIIEKGTTIGIYERDFITERMLLDILDKGRKRIREYQNQREQEKILEFRRVKIQGLKPIDFDMKTGDMVFLLCKEVGVYEKISGLLQGKESLGGGEIYYSGNQISIQEFLGYQGHKIGVIREMPVRTMVFSNMRIIDNLCLPFAKKNPGIWSRQRFQESIKKRLESLFPKECYDKEIKELTQPELLKIVYLRWYLFKPEIVVCIRPFESGDLEMIQITQEMLGFLIQKNISIIIITLTLKNVFIKNFKVCFVEKDESKEF